MLIKANNTQQNTPKLPLEGVWSQQGYLSLGSDWIHDLHGFSRQKWKDIQVESTDQL